MNWLKRLLGGAEKPVASEPELAAAPEAGAASLASEAMPDFPFPLMAVPGARAEGEWRRLQAEWRQAGASAVVLGDAEDVAQLAEGMSCNEQTAVSYLEAAAATTAEVFFVERRAAVAEDDNPAPLGEWPGEVPGAELGAHCDVLSGRPKPQVFIARIPTTRAWEIPAHLKYGAWNDCPAPEEHVAVLKYWSEKYGIEIYSVTGDVIECTVARPPVTKPAALALADEQFLYCTDIVHQGTQTLSALGATLKDSAVWYFWWD